MDTNTIIALVGIAVTIVLGMWGVYLAIRYSQKVEISYVEEACLSLIDDITQGISELEIRFRKKAISSNIVLLKASFMNTGRRDISPIMVEKKLRLILPKGYKWIDCQITDHANDMQIQVASIAPNFIEFEFGLFKAKEYFKFDALVTVPTADEAKGKTANTSPNDRLREVLNFDYRITDTRGIQILYVDDLRISTLRPPHLSDLPSTARYLMIWFMDSLWFGIITMVGGIGIYFTLSLLATPSIAYQISDSKNQLVVVETRIRNNNIELYNSTGFLKDVTPQEFDALQKTSTLSAVHEQEVFREVTAGVYVALGGLLVLFWLIRYFRLQKYRAILNIAGSKPKMN